MYSLFIIKICFALILKILMNAQFHILVQMHSALILLVLTNVCLAEMGSEAGMENVMVSISCTPTFVTFVLSLMLRVEDTQELIGKVYIIGSSFVPSIT